MHCTGLARRCSGWMVGVQSVGRQRHKVQSQWLGLGNKSTLVNVRKDCGFSEM